MTKKREALKPLKILKVEDEPSLNDIMAKLTDLAGAQNALGGSVSMLLGMVNRKEHKPVCRKINLWHALAFGFGLSAGLNLDTIIKALAG